MKRRDFLRGAAAISCGGLVGSGFWSSAYAAVAGESPYGPLSSLPDVNGLRLPAGFRSRVVATTFQRVGPNGHWWHAAPDGGACFPAASGGWVYTSNSEVPLGAGGVSMLRFDAGGAIVDARTILSGTSLNCAGGPTPWGTWLSCEEWELGQVWECYFDGRPAERRSDLGRFHHEAVAIDPALRRAYLTEDRPDGRFYRHMPDAWPSLGSGTLFAARIVWDDSRRLSGSVQWNRVPEDVSARLWPMSTYTTGFNGGEGCWYDAGLVYFTTKGDNRVWAYDASRERLEVIYDLALTPGAALKGVDNIVMSKSKDLYVAEDGGDMQICVITPDRRVAPFLQLMGHDGSEITGPAFNPRGDRFYFSSQRGVGNGGIGVTFEVSGPFRL